MAALCALIVVDGMISNPYIRNLIREGQWKWSRWDLDPSQNGREAQHKTRNKQNLSDEISDIGVTCALSGTTHKNMTKSYTTGCPGNSVFKALSNLSLLNDKMSEEDKDEPRVITRILMLILSVNKRWEPSAVYIICIPLWRPSTRDCRFFIARGIRNHGVRQCLGFCTADFWSSCAYESDKQKPKHCLTPGFPIPLFIALEEGPFLPHTDRNVPSAYSLLQLY